MLREASSVVAPSLIVVRPARPARAVVITSVPVVLPADIRRAPAAGTLRVALRAHDVPCIPRVLDSPPAALAAVPVGRAVLVDAPVSVLVRVDLVLAQEWAAHRELCRLRVRRRVRHDPAVPRVAGVSSIRRAKKAR